MGEPPPLPFNLRLVRGVLRSFLGDFSFKADRENKLVTIRAKGQENVLTYDQIIDEAERMFNDE